MKRKHIAILGSTGSIGTQALEVIARNPSSFALEVITGCNNVQLLIQQAIEFQPKHVVIANESKYLQLSEALRNYPIEVLSGEDSLSGIVELDSVDMVLTAMVGCSGLIPTIHAIQAEKDIALANKETLVVAGELICSMAREKGVKIIPVDSEHSAIFQCLVGENNPVEKVYLTASGGPFRTKNKEFLESVSREQALNHPNWDMGAKITIDSATMMNKGLEAIEARWLFDLDPSQIEIIVHPQSIVHSIVQFEDGSMKAQMGLPDMRLPIQYALSFPRRIPSTSARFSFVNFPILSFELPDRDTFQCIDLAYEAMEKSGNHPCILNAANEVAVEAFLHDQIGFMRIPTLIRRAMETMTYHENPGLQELLHTDQETRAYVKSLIV
jgi:1-deoxy-D-xylulose-5-phosphate reductoisomerase